MFPIKGRPSIFQIHSLFTINPVYFLVTNISEIMVNK